MSASDNEVLRPGEVLIYELDARGQDVTIFAIKIGMFPSDLIDILLGKQPITPDVASRLEPELGLPADFWMGLQADYDAQKG